MNMHMKRSFVQLMDLSDEILLIIFEELNNVEMLNYLMGINTRLDKILRHPMFTSHLTLMRSSSNKLFHPLADIMVDRFCSQILPQIHHNIEWLNLELLSVGRVLHASDYPNLYGLGLYQINYDATLRLFSDKSDLVRIFKNQISRLVMTVYEYKEQSYKEKVIMTLLTRIFTVFTNLTYLNLNKFTCIDIDRQNVSTPTTFSSSTLVELHINVARFGDCLYLLDGRFDQLRSFYLRISIISSDLMNPSSIIDNKRELPNSKCFSLSSNRGTSDYDELILPLLHRMSNLERLTLYLVLYRYTSFIDGNHLKKDIINQLPRLNKLLFNIYSFININDLMCHTSNEDVQCTFKNFSYYKISSSVDYFPKEEKSLCHIYSHPYRLKRYDHITNNFPGGLFKCVEEISLFDERPFEHEFFDSTF
ncbi:unnamed protein product [Rotaria socialis]|uniref:F-box domain-containing protein n=1 Tax=Rotaria socialis TaxID=392032 RepID=A0A819C0F7_9BILA|nr:unnamed protein product [Rotaria socialis]CAF4891265.1 unnamed protein product [Rotaria socialis]